MTVTLKAVGNISPGDTTTHQVTVTRKGDIEGETQSFTFQGDTSHCKEVIGHIRWGHLSHK
jgi:uncharacterized Zn-binding protein involved in type VI secretion